VNGNVKEYNIMIGFTKTSSLVILGNPSIVFRKNGLIDTTDSNLGVTNSGAKLYYEKSTDTSFVDEYESNPWFKKLIDMYEFTIEW